MSSEPEQDRPNFCSRCGNGLGSQAKFCPKCGKPVYVDSTPISDQTNIISPAPTSSTNPIPNQNPAPVYPYQNQRQNPFFGQKYSTPDTIQPTNGPVLTQFEIQIILLFSIVGLGSHLMRFLIIYNKFPSFIDLVLPFPFYFIGIFLIFQLYKRNLQSKGVNATLQVDKYDHMVSLVLSSFFLSNISHRIIPDMETTTIPERVHIPESSKLGFMYNEVERIDYLDTHLSPRSYMYYTIVSLIFSAIILYFYIEPINTTLSPTLRLVAAYFGGIVVVNVAPAVGKYNKEFSEMGRFRTLLVFFISFAITIIAIFGDSFLAALTNQV